MVIDAGVPLVNRSRANLKTVEVQSVAGEVQTIDMGFDSNFKGEGAGEMGPRSVLYSVACVMARTSV